jgi:hypothetical protein
MPFVVGADRGNVDTYKDYYANHQGCIDWATRPDLEIWHC